MGGWDKKEGGQGREAERGTEKENRSCPSSPRTSADTCLLIMTFYF